MKYLFIMLFCGVIGFSQSDYDRGHALFSSDNHVLAKPLLMSFLKTHPRHVASIELLGDIESSAGRWQAATSHYEKLVTISPNEARFQYKYGGALGMFARNSNKFKAISLIDDIRTSFEKAIELDPDHIDARWALIELNLQLPAILGGSRSTAMRYAAQLQSLSAVDGYLAKGRVSEHFEQYQAAEIYYLKAIETGHSKTSYLKLASLYKNRMNQPEKARKVMAQSTKENKT